ncbi:hypothetical protein BX616_010114 [Lobosporangium transversale]|nr:hypothetical protein BX616_010114 [Lobosporangium transversale]
MEWLRGFNLGHGAATCSGVPRQNQIPFTPLTQSVATQLFLEIKRYFRHDSVELYKKAEAQRNKGVISGSSIVDINENHSTIENFARLNGVTKGGRTMLPHNPPRYELITISESSLLQQLLHNQTLRRYIAGKAILGPDDPITSFTYYVGTYMTPGVLVTMLISNIGRDAPKGRSQKIQGQHVYDEHPRHENTSASDFN